MNWVMKIVCWMIGHRWAWVFTVGGQSIDDPRIQDHGICCRCGHPGSIPSPFTKEDFMI